MRRLMPLLLALLLLVPVTALPESLSDENEAIEYPRPEGKVVSTPLGERELLSDADWTP